MLAVPATLRAWRERARNSGEPSKDRWLRPCTPREAAPLWDHQPVLGGREERLPDAGHPCARTRGCCSGRGAALAPLAVPPGPLWKGSRGTALTWTHRRGLWWPSPRCWRHPWSPRPIGKSVLSWHWGRDAASAPARHKRHRGLPPLPQPCLRTWAFKPCPPPCHPHPRAQPHGPFQALNFIQCEVKDAGQVVVGAPGGGEVTLRRKNKLTRRCRAEQ